MQDFTAFKEYWCPGGMRRPATSTTLRLKATYTSSTILGPPCQPIYIPPAITCQWAELRIRVRNGSRPLTNALLSQPVVHQLPNLQTRTYLMVGENHVTALGKARLSASVASKLGRRPALGPAVAAFKVDA